MRITTSILLLLMSFALSNCRKDGFKKYDAASISYCPYCSLAIPDSCKNGNFLQLTTQDQLDTIIAHTHINNPWSSDQEIKNYFQKYDMTNNDLYIIGVSISSYGDSAGWIKKYKILKSDKTQTIEFNMKFQYMVGGSGMGYGWGLVVLKIPKEFTGYKVKGIIKFDEQGGIIAGAKDYKKNYSTE